MCIRTIRMRCTDGIDSIAGPTLLDDAIGHASRYAPARPTPSPERAQALNQEAHEGGRVDVDGDTGIGLAATAAAPVHDRAPARKLRRAVHLDVKVLRCQERRIGISNAISPPQRRSMLRAGHRQSRDNSCKPHCLLQNFALCCVRFPSMRTRARPQAEPPIGSGQTRPRSSIKPPETDPPAALVCVAAAARTTPSA